ncbi:adenosylmethionine--8-amino-7-oxononanoate transaminase [Sinosporangium siamense]|uniref:Adenosylmethionine-8-amino-7-oxononanoate aminotransferase n=1 Tax=Sinosporangium siamense TaxID=1367973 RepID=A0A919VC25_9ACTN|nr:adenosylmethionine--8-amino-7-oxononanoate transaminase [Sinosporangium siamense]GII97157.1 adenosylmethionine-8-amino-7-oxononanoate aminotransferase [Sinosporangium siamense]
MSPEEIAAFDREHIWHPYTAVPATVPPHVVTRTDGVRLTLADGRVLVDGMSSWWAAIHGYNHPRLNQALRDQLDSMAHVMFGGFTHEPAVRLARTLAGMTGLPKVFFADSGSVAVEVAIKMAMQCTGKGRLMTVRGGYHGDTFGAMAVCDPVNGMHHLFKDVLPQHVFASEPPAELSDAYLGELSDTVARHAHELAAIIVEPVVQNAGGMRFYHPAYLKHLRDLADEHGVLLIADEIATGFGRTGELFGCDHAGVRPDIMCLGKAMTGGYMTMAATLCTERVASAIGVLMHGPTYMANPLAAAVAQASLELLMERPWRDEVAAIGKGLADGLADARALPGVADVRVKGAIGVIETHDPVDVGRLSAVAMEHGVWLRPFGRLIYTMPPYVVDADDLHLITRAMVAAARAV